MADREPFYWGRAGVGFADITRWLKDTFAWLRGGLIWAIIIFIALSIHSHFSKPKLLPQVINSGGAPVDNSTKKSFWSLFYFGGQNQ